MYLRRDGALLPIREAIRLMGGMVVPGSSLIVGARLYAYWRLRHGNSCGDDAHLAHSADGNHQRAGGDDGQGDRARMSSGGGNGDVDVDLEGDTVAKDTTASSPEVVLRGWEVCAMVAVRFVVLPALGRVLVDAVHAWVVPIDDDLLRMYLMLPFGVPTASNAVVMVQMVAERRPGVARRMEQALLRVMLWQYAVAPVFITANMAMALMRLKSGEAFHQLSGTP